jgi:hypothetical protein
MSDNESALRKTGQDGIIVDNPPKREHDVVMGFVATTIARHRKNLDIRGDEK